VTGATVGVAADTFATGSAESGDSTGRTVGIAIRTGEAADNGAGAFTPAKSGTVGLFPAIVAVTGPTVGVAADIFATGNAESGGSTGRTVGVAIRTGEAADNGAGAFTTAKSGTVGLFPAIVAVTGPTVGVAADIFATGNAESGGSTGRTVGVAIRTGSTGRTVGVAIRTGEAAANGAGAFTTAKSGTVGLFPAIVAVTGPTVGVAADIFATGNTESGDSTGRAS
jgi:hypothetical protein